jgi:hypothetical protein
MFFFFCSDKVDIQGCVQVWLEKFRQSMAIKLKYLFEVGNIFHSQYQGDSVRENLRPYLCHLTGISVMVISLNS